LRPGGRGIPPGLCKGGERRKPRKRGWLVLPTVDVASFVPVWASVEPVRAGAVAGVKGEVRAGWDRIGSHEEAGLCALLLAWLCSSVLGVLWCGMSDVR